MKLEELLGNKCDKQLRNLEIKGICFDSREVRKGDIFFIIEGERFDVFSVLKEIEDEVSAFVAEEKQKRNICEIVTWKPVIFVKDVKKVFKKAVDRFYQVDTRMFKFIGITGTNGKTTTAYLIYQFLQKLGVEVSYLGTINYYLGKEKIKATHTTPDYLSLRKLFLKMKQINTEFIVMEVSSHSIAQKRIEGIDFSSCVFTNLSREHLDYHKTMENYFFTKRSFFLDNPGAIYCINGDDFYGRKLLEELKGKKISFGMGKNVDFKAEEVKVFRRGVEFFLCNREQKLKVISPLLGRYNVLNMLAALCVVSSLGFPVEELIKYIPQMKSVEGRLEEVATDVFVDYAHTPAALNNVLFALREMGYRKIIAVWGCGGERDKGKREIMGEIASRLADYNFITSDNPRGEDPWEICIQIKKGFKRDNFSIVIDREEAIAKALRLKKKWDKSVVVILGKGHEDYQLIGEKKIFFKDKEVVKRMVGIKE